MKIKNQMIINTMKHLVLIAASLLLQSEVALADTLNLPQKATGTYSMSTPETRIHTTVEMKVKIGQEKLYLELTEQLVAGSRKEEGVIQFAFYKSEEEPNVYFFHEIFASEKAFRLHREELHTKNWIGRIGEFLESKPTVQNLREITM